MEKFIPFRNLIVCFGNVAVPYLRSSQFDLKRVLRFELNPSLKGSAQKNNFSALSVTRAKRAVK
jgi:hypothetical protein